MDIQNKLVSRAKLEIMTDKQAKFFMTFISHYPPVWNTQIPTANITGRTMYVNPTWFMTLSPLEAAGLLLHEILHVAFKHPLRGVGKELKPWQFACDFWVNDWIVKNTRLKLPAGGLLSPDFTCEMSVDAIYEALLAAMPPQLQTWAESDCDPSNQEASQSPSAIKIEEAHVDLLMSQCATLQEMSGEKIPSALARTIHELRNPPLPWENLLSHWAKDRGLFGYNWSLPNRRFPNIFVPKRNDQGMLRKLMVALDVSGSIDERQFDYMVGQIEHARNIMGIDECIIILFDHVIEATHVLLKGQPITSVELVGFGGTDLNPVMEEANKHKPDVLVVLSDLDVRDPYVEYKGDVLWLIIDNPERQVPYGEKIHINLRDGLC